ncbi:MAG TPA: energy transducer TonB [Longimicrobium sp.]|jgi:TonB family protein|nr:energy transducer TonB [Longimicrobium sp.]
MAERTPLYDLERALFRMMEQRRTRNDRAPLLAVHVALDGTPGVIELREPSGDPALDTAALKVAMMARFEPARDAAALPALPHSPTRSRGGRRRAGPGPRTRR